MVGKLKMDKTKQENTTVIFRRWKPEYADGIIAIFPEIPSSIDGYHCSSYEQIGQHGGCDPILVVSKTKPTKNEQNSPDYLNLKKELEDIGYVLDVKQRFTRKMFEKCRQTAKEWSQENEK